MEDPRPMINLSRSKTVSERDRWPPLTRMLMSGTMNGEPPREYNLKERFDIWMVNEGRRKLFISLFTVLHLMIFGFGLVNYSLKDNLNGPRETFGFSFPIARAAALVLHVDVALILLPVCRTLVSLARQTPLNGIIQFDENISFHRLVAWSILAFSWIHTIAHWVNFAKLASSRGLGFKGFLLANVATGPGWSGYVMLVVLMLMSVTAWSKYRRANYERFWYTHHLFVVFFAFWAIHGAFCMIKTDFPPFCGKIGIFWKYWIFGAVLYLVERLMREIRGRYKTTISKVIQHPSNVVEIQIRKEHTKTRPGQYIFLCCPEISIFQYHPFTLTSAPEENFISVHIRCVGHFTNTLAKVLGCDFETATDTHTTTPTTPAILTTSTQTQTQTVPKTTNPNLRRILPRLFIDGPFGSASEDVFKYEVALLVGAGIGVTPFASILKSIWFRMNSPGQKMALRKVYFFWVCRDWNAFEWFRSLLLAIEAEDMDNRIEIHTYLTTPLLPDDATNIILNDTHAEHDTITGLRSPTNFGRPNWDMVFRCIRKIHGAPAEAGVFFCGPKPLGSILHVKCNMHSEPGFHFVWGKENF